MKCEYNEEVDKVVLHLPLFTIDIRTIFSDMLSI